MLLYKSALTSTKYYVKQWDKDGQFVLYIAGKYYVKQWNKQRS